MGNTSTSRADDEKILTWLRMREAGVTSGAIAELYAVTSSHVRTATNRVFDCMDYQGKKMTGHAK
jgi:hypothetical protein